jgi:Aromatic-ring-opening dioxygenase LigAB, LigA subunit
VSAYEVAKLCRQTLRDPTFVQDLQDDAEAATAPFDLTDEERTALFAGDVGTLYRYGCPSLLLSYLTHAPLFGLDVATYAARMRLAAPPA